MKLNTFKILAKSSNLIYFTSRSYSLELLFILAHVDGYEGIDKLFLSIVSPKPKYPAFKTYLYFLRDKGCIYILDGKTKISAKFIKLSEKSFIEFKKIFD